MRKVKFFTEVRIREYSDGKWGPVVSKTESLEDQINTWAGETKSEIISVTPTWNQETSSAHDTGLITQRAILRGAVVYSLDKAPKPAVEIPKPTSGRLDTVAGGPSFTPPPDDLLMVD